MHTHPRRLRALFQALVTPCNLAPASLPSLATDGAGPWSARRAHEGARARVGLLAAVSVLLTLPLIAPMPAEATTATISGTAFQDLNRDGVQQADEDPFVDHLIYLFDGDGDYVANRRTDSDGRFAFTGIADGAYTVSYAPGDWRDIREDWVPTTTGALHPEHEVTVSGGDMVTEFGWRPIEKSDDVSDPISEVTGPEGLLVQSYNDVISAQEIYEHITGEFTVGDEAPSTTVRFAHGDHNTAQTSISQSNGEITRVRTTVYASYGRWLTGGDHILAHEYGHAWMNYHNFYVQQDVERTWVTYLGARGMDPDDDRLGTSHAWMPGEIAAEDYRILLASDTAASSGHMNRDITHPEEIDGFEEWLREEFTTPPGGTDDGGSDGSEDADDGSDEGTEEDDTDHRTEDAEEEDTSSDEGGDSDEGTEDDGAEDTSSDEDESALRLSVETYKVRGVNHADLSWAGGEASEVDMYRNGTRITTSSGSGHSDDTGSRGSATYTYRVCEAGTDVCSEEHEIRF